ncbi:MAG: tandem-95 repeat protein [Phenylobacterium sp.]|nr:tandem-95 repeat protein [Phenylobacterium sp.]
MPNLIVDGGFDNGLNGWSVTAPNGSATTGTGSPTPGFQGFSNSSTGGDLTQTFATIVGAHYHLTFSSFDNVNSGSNFLRVIVAGGSTAIGLTQTFTQHAIDFVATSTSTTLDFNFTTAGGTGIIGIDNVDVELVNNPPVISGPVTGSVPEDSSSTLSALAHASDPDAGTTLSVVPGALPAGVTYNAATQSFTLDASNAAYQHLASGATTTVSVSYGVSDGIVTTPATAVWTIIGTNDAPVVSGAVTAAATEDGATVSVNALVNASDVDDSTTLSAANLPASLPAGVTYNAATHSFTLDPTNAAYQHLAAGETQTVTVSYGVSDGSAMTAAQTTFTVNGTNDAPVLGAPLSANVVVNGTFSSGAAGWTNAAGTGVEVNPAGVYGLDGSHGLVMELDVNGGLPFDDVSQSVATVAGRTYTFSFDTAQRAGFPGVTNSYQVIWNGQVIDTVNPASTTFEHHTYSVVATGSVGKVEFREISNSDGVGGIIDNVVLTSTAGAISEIAGVHGQSVVDTAALTLSLGDADLSNTHSVSVAAPTVTWSGGATPAGLAGALAGAVQTSLADTTGTGAGSVTATFAAPDKTFDFLGKGETLTVTYNLTVTDSAGATSTQPVTFVVTGANDAPIISGPGLAQVVEGAGAIQIDALARASDLDANDHLSVVNVPATLPAGVTYDAASHSFSLDSSNAAYQHLAQGVSQQVVVTYGVFDGTSTVSTQAVFTVIGQNDAPAVSGVVTGTTAEDGAALHLDALANASDVDDATTLSVVGVPPLPPGLTYDPATHSFVVDPSNAAFQHLAAGEAQVLTVGYGVSDGIATTPASVSFTVTGTNDAPVVSGAVTGSGAEDGAAVNLDALANASDIDDGTTLAVVNVPSTLPAGVTYDAATHSFAIDPANAAYQHLAAGQADTVTVSYGVTDGIATTPASVTFTVTGTNDAPVVSGAVTGSATEDGSAVHLDALANASDVDDATTLSVVNVPSTLPAGVTYDAATHSFAIDPSNAAYQHLAAGQTTSLTVSYGVSDGLTTTAASVSFTVTGTNDAPVVSGAVTGSATEDGAAVHLDALANASDVDDATTLSVVNVPPTLPAGVTYDAATHSFALDPANAAYQHLAAGQTTTLTVSYGVSDGLATTAASVTFTVTGTNDGPVVSGAVTGSATEDGPTVQLDALANAADVDDNTTLSVVNVPATLPAGVTYDAVTHSFALNPADAAYQHLAAGQTTTLTVSYGVSDGLATTAASVTFTVTGTNDAPVVAGAVTGSATEDGPTVQLDALANASDVDDNTTLSVVNVPSTLPAGVTYDAATHSFAIDPSNAAYQHLAAGQAATVTVSYGVTDGIATTPASVTFTVTGTNDAPVVSGAVTGSATEDGAVVKLDGLGAASDVDDNTTLSVVNVPSTLPAGVTYDAATHSFALDPANAAYQSLGLGATQVVTVNYGVSDGSLTTAGAVSWTVTGANDAPIAHADTALVNEKASVVIDVLGNDTDVDAGDSKSIVSVGATALGGVVTIVDGHLVYSATADTLSLLNLGQSQVDTFTYTMKDSHGALSTSTVAVTVNGVADGADLIGGNHDQTLIGTGLDEHISGGNAKDTLSGGGGADTLDGGNGTDSLAGGSGIDRLYGGNGADTLDGGLGNDTLTGGNGPDVFVFGLHFGHDVITDFANEDTLSFAHGLFTGFSDFMAHAHQVGNDVVISYGADDTIVLQHTTLSALAPSDVLLG